MTVTFKYVAVLLLATFAARAGQINVAAASNLTEVARVLGARCEARTGIHVVFSYGSTAQLTTQIENGAPFDVFLAADAVHVEELERKHILASLHRHGGNRAATAAEVGISLRKLYYRLGEYQRMGLLP